MNDAELLLTYARERSEGAFKTLVDRYIRLVYSACWRRLGDHHLAEDATQGVFILLSQKAGQIHPSRLAGWLLTAAGYACANLRKMQLRQQRREQVVAMQNDHPAQAVDRELLATLDEGLDHLKALDRDAVVLRYLQQQSLRQVGQSLGISEDAARKRVDRGLEKLRRYLLRQGVATTSPALAAVLAEQSQTTPLTPATQQTLTQAILQACHANATSAEVGFTIAKGIETMMLTVKLKTAAMLLLAMLAITGAGWAVLAHGTGQQDALAATPTSTAPTPATPATRPTSEPLIDLSTPEKTLISLGRACKAGDRKQTFACLGVDPNRPPTPLDAGMELGLAQARLILATARAFGTDGEEARTIITLDIAIKTTMIGIVLLGEKSRITGDSAELTIVMPELMFRLAQPDLAAALRQWTGTKIPFRKQPEGWVLGDLSPIVRMHLTLHGRPGQPNWFVTDAATQTAFCIDYARAMDQTTADIESGRATTWSEASQALDQRWQKVLNTYGDFWAISLVHLPAAEARGKP